MSCCNNNDNPANYTSVGGEGKGYDSQCEPLPRVLFEPLSGTRLILPSLVTLRSDNPDAVIHYTTDGSAPDRLSPIYTTPLTISGPADIIRAIAIVDGCPEGPESIGSWQQWTPAAHFTYACTTTDKTGQWGAFAADGNPDYNWEVQIQVTALTSVKEFTIMQLFPDGTFTGSIWSTKEFPLSDFPLNRAFPLVIFEAAVQKNVAYHNDYSVGTGHTLGVGAHTLSLYGSPWTALPSTHLFKLRIVFSDGSVLERVVDSTCDALPGALCPVPSFSSLTPQCGPPLRIDLTYAIGVGVAFTISRSVSGANDYSEIISGNTAASPETYQDTTVEAGVTYDYVIEALPPGCVVTLFSNVATATAIPDASVSIAASVATIDPGGSTTISWASSNITGNVTITAPIGVQPGNVAGNQVVSPGATTTYTIQGVNACGVSASAQVTVTVRPAATCGASQPLFANISGYIDFFFVNAIGPCGPWDIADPNDPNWNGQWIRNGGATTCAYVLAGTQRAIVARTIRLSTSSRIIISGGLWILEVVGLKGGADLMIWRGTKSSGDTPLGTYTRTSGCASLPTTLTLV